FAWRLYRAGLNLEHASGRGKSELVLTARDGEVVASAAQAPAPRWPALVGELPVGPLREHVGGIIGVRALLPVVRATSVRTQRRALNADAKTIAMLSVDLTTITQPRPATTPGRITGSAPRGYHPPASNPAPPP